MDPAQTGTHRTAVALAAEIDAGLRSRATPERAERERAYLKSEITHYGVTVPQTRAAVTAALRGLGSSHTGLSHAELIATATLLWAAPEPGPEPDLESDPVHERRAAAIALLEARSALLGPDDLALLERFLRESRTWALVDDLAGSVVGPLIERAADATPERAGELTDTLDRWAADEDFWIRRSALLAHLLPLRAGRGDFARFGRIADGMLDEREFFVRKAIGWVLRDTSRTRPELVFEWILPRAARASGLTVREAIRRLPQAQQAEVRAARAAS